MSAARIGRIRMKAGGAEVRLIAQADPEANYCGKIIDHARRVAEMDEPGSELVGFVVVGLFSCGSASVGMKWDNKRSPIPRALLPSYLAEVIRRDVVTAPEAEEVACNVVNRANGFDDA